MCVVHKMKIPLVNCGAVSGEWVNGSIMTQFWVNRVNTGKLWDTISSRYFPLGSPGYFELPP